MFRERGIGVVVIDDLSSGHRDFVPEDVPFVEANILDGAVLARTLRINGDDYPTPDGTCVRDYVHVQDLAFSHVIAAEKLMAGVPLQPAYNLGSGQGQSVREVLDTLLSVMGAEFSPRIGARRPGDPPRIVANQDLAAADLQWEMRHSVEEMARSAWYAAKPLRALGRGH